MGLWMPLSRAHGKTPREPWQYGDMALKEVKKDKREGAAVGVVNACRHALRFTLPAGVVQEGRNRRSAVSRTRESLEQGFVKTSVFEEGRPGSALAGLGKGG